MSKKKSLILFTVCGYIIFNLLMYYPIIKSEIISSVKMWAFVLVPSLFPYLVISVLLTSSGILKIFSPVISLISKLFKINKKSAEVYLCSLFCGYPCGALCSADLCRNGEVSPRDAERLICYTNNAGPLFLISAVGCSFLNSFIDGVALYFIQTISAFVCGLVLRNESKNCNSSRTVIRSGSADIAYCCENAVKTMINICGFVVLSAVCSKLIIITCNNIAADLKIKLPKYFECIIYSIFEITNGAKYISAYCNSNIGFAFLCMVISWSGISVFLQIKSVVEKNVRIKRLIQMKIFQSLIGFACGLIYKSLKIKSDNIYNANKYIELSLALSVLIFIIFIFKKYKQKA